MWPRGYGLHTLTLGGFRIWAVELGAWVPALLGHRTVGWIALSLSLGEPNGPQSTRTPGEGRVRGIRRKPINKNSQSEQQPPPCVRQHMGALGGQDTAQATALPQTCQSSSDKCILTATTYSLAVSSPAP